MYLLTGSIRCFLLPWVSEVHPFILQKLGVFCCGFNQYLFVVSWASVSEMPDLFSVEQLATQVKDSIFTAIRLSTVSWLSTLRKRTYRYTIYSRCFNDMVWGSKILLWSCIKAIPLDLYVASLVAVEKLSQTDIILRANCYLARTPQQGITSVPTQYRL